jgi:hypothetical protein
MPAQTITLTPRQTTLCENSLILAMTRTEGEWVDGPAGRESYLFVRLFVLSLANPADVGKEGMAVLGRLMNENVDSVSAAAIQCLLVWAMKKAYIVSDHFVFRTGCIVVAKDRDPVLVNLAKFALRCFAQKSRVAAVIVEKDKHAQIEGKDVIEVKRKAWTFPHVVGFLGKIAEFPVRDDNVVEEVLGYILEYLGCDANGKGV